MADCPMPGVYATEPKGDEMKEPTTAEVAAATSRVLAAARRNHGVSLLGGYEFVLVDRNGIARLELENVVRLVLRGGTDD